ncbi:TPA: hypothetical protein ACQUHP_005548 [Bacillus cereus]
MANDQTKNKANTVDLNIDISNAGHSNQERDGIWLIFGGLLLILLILFFVINKEEKTYNVGSVPLGLFSNTPSAVQTNVVQDKLYVTNGQNGTISVVDSKTDQVKVVLPFR